jgi:hypothetical protein
MTLENSSDASIVMYFSTGKDTCKKVIENTLSRIDTQTVYVVNHVYDLPNTIPTLLFDPTQLKSFQLQFAPRRQHASELCKFIELLNEAGPYSRPKFKRKNFFFSNLLFGQVQQNPHFKKAKNFLKMRKIIKN